MKLSDFSLVFVLLFSSSCSLFVDEYQVNSRKVIAYLLEDLPLPDDADIIKVPTVLLGTGDSISGRIILESGYSPAENLIFYGNETLSTGWQLISSKVGEEVTLIATDPTSIKDVKKFCEYLNHSLISFSDEDGIITFKVKMGD